MDWNRAKNYTIILLLVLNGLLLGLNLRNHINKRLSAAEVNNIKTVLENNGIAVEAEIPRASENLSQLTLSGEGYNLFELVNIFFEPNVNVKRTEEFNVTIFKAGSKTLRINGGTIDYTDKDAAAASLEEAEVTAEGYMDIFENLFPGFKKEVEQRLENGYRIEYNMYYKGSRCFNNICVFEFNSEGMTLKLKYSEPVGFTGVKSEVYTADVILYSFMNNIREIYPDEELTISEIALGYYSEYEQEDTEEEALPYYQIRTAEKSECCYINGYTGSFSTD
ncbi:MAG: two-component system regulatory protein YycI [Clostridiales bacterium]|nr:two-component system regulatory protein YycI [Clostridiales bacterium]